MKSRDGKSQREENSRREKIREEKESEERSSGARKGRKVAKPVFFQWFVAPEDRKVGSLKRRVRSHRARWEMKKCTPLWREAHLQVKKLKTKTPHLQSTFGSWDVEKVHAIVARSTFRTQNLQSTPFSEHFWKLRCRKSARRCGAKHISKSKCTKHLSVGRLLEVEMWKKCTPLWREAHFQVKMYKTHHFRTTFGSWDVKKVHAVVARSTFRSQNVKNTRGSDHFFGSSDVVSRGRRKGLCTFSKVSKTWGFCTISKNDGRRGAFEEDLQRCISRARRSTKDMFIKDVRRSGRWFPERGCILEHQIFRFAEMILRDRCSTSYDLASLFRGRRSTFDRWTGKIAKRIGTRLSALHSTFHFGRRSRRIASFLMLSNSKNEEVSQFWMLSSSKNEEVSQNCFVFDVVNFEKWGSLAEELRLQACR